MKKLILSALAALTVMTAVPATPASAGTVHFGIAIGSGQVYSQPYPYGYTNPYRYRRIYNQYGYSQPYQYQYGTQDSYYNGYDRERAQREYQRRLREYQHQIWHQQHEQYQNYDNNNDGD
jgi:hypothetical protein